jgi:hypothetical protein
LFLCKYGKVQLHPFILSELPLEAIVKPDKCSTKESLKRLLVILKPLGYERYFGIAPATTKWNAF